jgi:hypothetical protein
LPAIGMNSDCFHRMCLFNPDVYYCLTIAVQ